MHVMLGDTHNVAVARHDHVACKHDCAAMLTLFTLIGNREVAFAYSEIFKAPPCLGGMQTIDALPPFVILRQGSRMDLGSEWTYICRTTSQNAIMQRNI